MTTETTLPTVREELNRKTVEAMLWLTEQHESGQITDAEFYVAREVAFQIVSGLVDKDISELTWSPEPEGFKERAELRVFKKGDEALVLRQRVGEKCSYAAKARINKFTHRSPQRLNDVEKIFKQRGWSPLE